jgi:hypothetical protein
MSEELTTTDFPAGALISENAVPADSPEDASRPAGGTRRLRRWSVAELIARAVAAPRTAA